MQRDKQFNGKEVISYIEEVSERVGRRVQTAYRHALIVHLKDSSKNKDRYKLPTVMHSQSMLKTAPSTKTSTNYLQASTHSPP